MFNNFSTFCFLFLKAFFLALNFFPFSIANSREIGFNVFCTSNLDGTGVCSDPLSGRSLNCIVIPGQVIDCKNNLGYNLQCVLIGQYAQNQSEFFCNEQLSSAPSSNVNSLISDPVLGVDVLPNVLFNVF